MAILDRSRRRILYVEVSVILVLFVLPNLLSGISSFLNPPVAPREETWRSEFLRFFYNVQVLAPALFITWGAGEGLKRFGFARAEWTKGLALVVLSVFAGFAAYRAVYYLAWGFAPSFTSDSVSSHLYSIRQRPEGFALISFRVVIYALGAFVEEFILRGYLITRLTDLWGKPWLALLCSTALFTSYHVYQGWLALPTIFIMGLSFGFSFLASGSLWPGTIAHFITNALRIFI